MKRILVACDGTWNTARQADRTNVVRTHEAVLPRGEDGAPQLAHYVAGVGTKPWERVLGGVFGFGLSDNVRDAYRFVVEHFEPGDEIFLIGFSRGAYTARSTAGLIRKAGVLRRDLPGDGRGDRRGLDARVAEAYALYRTGQHPEDPDVVAFRRTHSHETRIRFVGVWDTVGSLGIPLSGVGLAALVNRRWQFHDTDLSSRIDTAVHAVAIDERRGPFTPAMWRTDGTARQEVEQVWFAGVHSDVGGGYAERGLADLSWTWLAGRAADCGLTLDPDVLAAARPDPDGVLHESRTGVYRLLRPAVREPGAADPDSESAATSALRRRPRRPTYAENLTAYRRSEAFRRTRA
ncbi:DUF2235 domain-containing protein [Nocardioidaceae bacterium]|nr:DUF2235 domain-containing protein [Nocardioidaceae bacterium]